MRIAAGPPAVTLQDANHLTRQDAKAMMQVAQGTQVGFVPLFETFLHVEGHLAGEISLYADEVHLNARGDLLYSELAYQYLEAP
jgi:hypothetical protein